MTATISDPTPRVPHCADHRGRHLGAAAPPPQAGAVSPQVRNACAGDYLGNCRPTSPRARRRANARAVGARLSKGCITALIAAGEVSRPRSPAARPAIAAKSFPPPTAARRSCAAFGVAINHSDWAQSLTGDAASR